MTTPLDYQEIVEEIFQEIQPSLTKGDYEKLYRFFCASNFQRGVPKAQKQDLNVVFK